METFADAALREKFGAMHLVKELAPGLLNLIDLPEGRIPSQIMFVVTIFANIPHETRAMMGR